MTLAIRMTTRDARTIIRALDDHEKRLTEQGGQMLAAFVRLREAIHEELEPFDQRRAERKQRIDELLKEVAR